MGWPYNPALVLEASEVSTMPPGYQRACASQHTGAERNRLTARNSPVALRRSRKLEAFSQDFLALLVVTPRASGRAADAVKCWSSL